MNIYIYIYIYIYVQIHIKSNQRRLLKFSSKSLKAKSIFTSVYSRDKLPVMSAGCICKVTFVVLIKFWKHFL